MTWHDATADHNYSELFASYGDTTPDVEARSPKGAVVARAWSTSQGPLISWTEPLQPPSAQRQQLTRELAASGLRSEVVMHASNSSGYKSPLNVLSYLFTVWSSARTRYTEGALCSPKYPPYYNGGGG